MIAHLTDGLSEGERTVPRDQVDIVLSLAVMERHSVAPAEPRRHLIRHRRAKQRLHLTRTNARDKPPDNRPAQISEPCNQRVEFFQQHCSAPFRH